MRHELETEVFGVDDSASHASPGNADGHRAEAGHVDRDVDGGRERRHVVELDERHAAVCAVRADVEKPCGHFEAEVDRRRP